MENLNSTIIVHGSRRRLLLGTHPQHTTTPRKGIMSTFTLEEIAVSASHAVKLPYKVVYPAALAYLHQIEIIDNRTIDQDAIDKETADFIIGAIKAGNEGGDLVPHA